MNQACRYVRLLVQAGLATAPALGSASMTGCNTVEGAGEDIESLGDSIDDEAEDAND